MSGIESFGPRKKPRVIYFGFGQKEWFNALKEDVDGVLEELGFPVQDQPFTAHLTLGRVRSLRNLSRYHEVIEGMKTRSCESVYFDSLVYYRSILGSRGPEYSKLEEIRFRSG
jgi:2'-5' RNA ligase